MDTGNSCRKPHTLSGDEVDAVYAKHLLLWKAGERKALKKAINRRERRWIKKMLAELRRMWYE